MGIGVEVGQLRETSLGICVEFYIIAEKLEQDGVEILVLRAENLVYHLVRRVVDVFKHLLRCHLLLDVAGNFGLSCILVLQIEHL